MYFLYWGLSLALGAPYGLHSEFVQYDPHLARPRDRVTSLAQDRISYCASCQAICCQHHVGKLGLQRTILAELWHAVTTMLPLTA
jgi:hypothetical protein